MSIEEKIDSIENKEHNFNVNAVCKDCGYSVELIKTERKRCVDKTLNKKIQKHVYKTLYPMCYGCNNLGYVHVLDGLENGTKDCPYCGYIGIDVTFQHLLRLLKGSGWQFDLEESAFTYDDGLHSVGYIEFDLEKNIKKQNQKTLLDICKLLEL